MSAEVTMPDGSTRTVSRLFSQPSTTDITAYAKALLDPNLHPMRRRFAEWIVNKGTTGANTKQAKGAKIDYTSVGLCLAPNKESGYNVCPRTTPGCTAACIYNGGVTTAWTRVKPSQIARTRLLFENRPEFDKMLLKELQAFDRKYKNNLVCRLNVYSDISWEKLTPWLFEKLPRIQFYDYTKIAPRMRNFLKGDFPPNYHLTFSRSEVNEEECKEMLSLGGTVAVVFPESQFPERFLGHPVFNGDETDLRFLDPWASICGLKAKNKFGRSDQTGFVVRLPVI